MTYLVANVDNPCIDTCSLRACLAYCFAPLPDIAQSFPFFNQYYQSLVKFYGMIDFRESETLWNFTTIRNGDGYQQLFFQFIQFPITAAVAGVGVTHAFSRNIFF